jgi:hypothetical protein
VEGRSQGFIIFRNMERSSNLDENSPLLAEHDVNSNRRIWLKELIFDIPHILFSMIIVTPASLLVWRCIWGLLDMYAFQKSSPPLELVSLLTNTKLSKHRSKTLYQLNLQIKDTFSSPQPDNFKVLGTIIFVGAVLLRTATVIFQHRIYNYVKKWEDERRYAWKGVVIVYLLIYLYMFINTIITVSIWKGAWHFLDEVGKIMVEEKDICTVHVISMAISLVLLLFSNTTLSLVACPLSVSSDQLNDIFLPPTFLGHTLNTQSTRFASVLNIIYSAFIYGVSVILWWSVWHLIDAFSYVFTQRELWDAKYKSDIFWSHLIIGYSICIVIYLAQYPVQAMCATTPIPHHFVVFKLHYFSRKILILCATIGCVLVWKGLWSGLDVWTFYILGNQPNNFVITGICSSLLMIFLGCFNTSSSRGVCRDTYVINENTDEYLFQTKIRHPLCSQLNENRTSTNDLITTTNTDLNGNE